MAEGRRQEAEGAQGAQRATGGRGRTLEVQEEEQDADTKQMRQQKYAQSRGHWSGIGT